ncbi:Peptidase S1 and S6, chymotrypsin/Hap [Planococcus halocryophilus Or1]|uniref:Serine protease n=1 Tax=Planococcus halocryophilus TaxID=1215089 RepID=A0A1C7DRE3_9BACL|nr:S1C family serine protease [Planococcus halocryophilus]ANU13974.1 serine protease [Planococcus halocryophilus]EMF47427.1 Peptidase S1 and S6, chymotrypsin/Hap [Planococcus halocryophilus Or1]
MTRKTSKEIKKTNQIIAALSVALVLVMALGIYVMMKPDLPEPSLSAQQQTESNTPEAETELASMIANAKTHVYTLYTDLEQGSGFLINNQGDILTNGHVVLDASYITVKNSDGQEFNGNIIGKSETQDLAIVRVDELAGKEPLEIEMEPVDIGTPVVAIGSPNDQSNTATTGEVTDTDLDFSDQFEYTNLYEMSAEIAQGSSGGPLIAADTGKILGINSIIIEENPESGYAIPIYTVWDQLTEWINNPIAPEEQEIVLQDVKDAYFADDLLESFISSYYELLPYSLNDSESSFYLSYIFPGSDAEQQATGLIEEYSEPNRIYDIVEPTITAIEIEGDSALVEAEAEFTYHDKASDKSSTISHEGIYTVVIDEYGDYQIEGIVNQ